MSSPVTHHKAFAKGWTEIIKAGPCLHCGAMPGQMCKLGTGYANRCKIRRRMAEMNNPRYNPPMDDDMELY